MNPGILAALGAAVLFGASTPLAKLFVGTVHPVMLAGLLYLGSGIGLLGYRMLARGAPRPPRRRSPARTCRGSPARSPPAASPGRCS